MVLVPCRLLPCTDLLFAGIPALLAAMHSSTSSVELSDVEQGTCTILIATVPSANAQWSGHGGLDKGFLEVFGACWS